jgi:adenosylhomocysteine nucleosidase
MEDEIAMLRKALKNQRTEQLACFEFFLGELEEKPVALLRCGIGKVNAAVGCALLLSRYQPDFVINTGSAGGVADGLTFGDAIISDGLVYHDADVTAFNYALGQIPGMPPVFIIPEDLISKAEQAVDALKREGVLPASFNYTRGLIGSSDVFMHEPERIAATRAKFPELKAVEMEGTSIAHTCYLFKTPALVIRALSDVAGAESPVTFSEFLPVASRQSAEIVRRLIRDY